MSNNIEKTLPAWLRNSHNIAHINHVFNALSQRERTRIRARIASCHQSHPSWGHRISHLPSTITIKAELIAHYAATAGSHPSNEEYNRYADIHPYDRTRVVVCPGEPSHPCSSSIDSGRYLNANWVRELAGGKWWIATQAPLPHTALAFLSVILDGVSPPPESRLSKPCDVESGRVRTIVQLTKNMEGNVRKAHVYFPEDEGQSLILEPKSGCKDPPIRTTLVSSQTIKHAHCVRSVVSLERLSSSRQPIGKPVLFQHFLYASWPDHGVPAQEDREGLLRFVRLVDEANRDASFYADGKPLDTDPPIMVNCSAGVGRTGAYIALCSVLRHSGLLSPPPPIYSSLPASPLGPLPDGLEDDLVALEIDSLREQRPGMVQRPDQIIMIYETLVFALASASSPPATSSQKA